MSSPPFVPRSQDYAHASMVVLVFRFRGHRKLVASRVMTSSDFEAELAAHLPVLARLYPGRELQTVEIVSYQGGRFYTDPWPDALRVLEGRTTAPDT